MSTAATLLSWAQQLPRGPSDQRTGAKGDSEIPHVSSSQPLLDLKNTFQTWSPLRGKDGDCGRVSSSTHAKDWVLPDYGEGTWRHLRTTRLPVVHFASSCGFLNWMVDVLILFRQRPLQSKMTLTIVMLRTHMDAEKHGMQEERPPCQA